MSTTAGFEADAASIANVDWASKNYLVVDDFIGIRQLLRESLRNLGAKNIDQASSGGEAIALLSRIRYDVVLCDYDLGEGKNGQQLLEEARVRNLLMPSSVWMMVSAEKSVESVMGAAEHQPDAYLIKPITEGVLLTRLNRVWHKKQVFRPIDQAFAEKDYLRAARLCDAQIEVDKVHRIELLRMKANLMIRSGEQAKAREAYEQVMAEREYQWARAGLAKIRMANGEYEQARQVFQGVIADNRYYIDAYDQLANAYQYMGQPQEACSILERAARLSPNSVLRQRNLGQVCFTLGNTGMAEKAFRKCIAIGEYSVMKSADAYLGLARVCGQKNDIKEALQLLLTVQRDFPHDDHIQLRAKITEGLVYHESGDYRRARKAGDELEELLNTNPARPDTATCLEMATLLLAVGVKQAPVELLCYVIRNNHDNILLQDEVQKIFEKARMGHEGIALILASKKEASDMMNQGVLLWKTGKLREAVEWMRGARMALPNNLRILFNSAQILLSHLQQGYDEALGAEATEVLLHVDRIQPGQLRFAQLMERLTALTPRVAQDAAGDLADET
jgi:tetratricopeptide (TPR) repeat protein